MENKITSIYMVGVGGQGIILASDILCEVGMRSGFDIKKSEVHGMAQRGGSVTSHVRYGEKVYSPLSAKGDVDILVAFERMEVLRYLDYIRPSGRIIVSDQELYPPIVNLGEAAYPENVTDTARRWTPHVQEVNAVEIATSVGNIRTANMVVLGALSVWLDFEEKIWDEVFREALPARVLEANLKAFSAGRKMS